MKYILYVDIKGLEITCFVGIKYVIKEIPREVLMMYIDDMRNITQDYTSTEAMNKCLNTKFEVVYFSQSLDIGDQVYFVKQYTRGNEKVYRYYQLDFSGQTEDFVRKSRQLSVDRLIFQCNEANRAKANRSKTEQDPEDHSWAIRDYFNRVDKAWRLYDSALMKAKPESHSQLAYHKRTLEKDLDSAFKKACNAKVSVEDIRDVENQVLRERLRRLDDAQ